ncbi:FtsX-like permease family protein [Janibacter anophelis]|uniref:FtsX-like permease family protein n=1 Tax=Janibacter anophelis TaxID=319054 RepID=UPI00083314EB|nr:FtsX-like permease family protein [Janibacter anophelis]
MWAALRHRRGQVIALALVSALVATCAVFAPVFARSVDQALLRVHVTEADPVTTATAISRTRTAQEPTLLPGAVADLVPAELAAVSEEPVLAMRYAGQLSPQRGKKPSPVVVRSRSAVCDHLEVTGSCPQAAGEVLVSQADAQAWGWERGARLAVPQTKFTRFDPDRPDVELTVVGTYTVVDDPSYWLSDRPDGKSGVPQPDLDNLPGIDDLFTAEATFADAMPTASAVVVLPLDPDTATLDSLPAAAASAERLHEEHPELGVDETTRTVVDGIATGRGQTAVIVPFVMVQLALLSVLVLFLVAQAAVDQRRHDVALARLRGRSRSGARRLLLTELVVPVLLGLPIGFAVALLVAVLVRRSMLPEGIPFEIPLAIVPWLLGALVVSVLAVHLAARPVLREPVNDLLRSVRPSAAAGAPVAEVVVVVLAVLGVAGLATGALTGPAALATPTLLAIAVGVLAARLVPRLAARRARSAMRRGRVAAAVAGHAIARRPAARRVLVVTTVATAIAVFGANAVVVADRNRQARAELETGAPAVVTVDSPDAPSLMAAADTLADRGIAAAPVAMIHPRADEAAATMATDPERFVEVAHPQTVRGLDPDLLTLPEQEPITLPAGDATARVSWDLTVAAGEEPPTLVLDMTTPDGDDRSARIATLGPRATGSRSIDERLFCSDGCRLAGVRVSTSGVAGSEVRGTVTVSDLAVGGRPVPVTGEGVWASVESADGTGLTVTTKGEDLHLDVAAADGADVSAYIADVPRPMPAIVSGGVAQQGDVLRVLDVTGGQTEVRVDERVAALPAATDRGVLLSLPALARVTGALDTTRTERQLWLADASPAAVAEAEQVLDDAGIAVRHVRTTAEADGVYDQSASGWGLQLALLGGALAVVLAGIVLLILAITGWRAAVRDLAALRVSGVGHRSVGRALRTEHLTSVAVGVVLGAVCALAGSWIALPALPFFTSPAAVPALDHAPAWPAVGAATVAVAAILLLIAWALALGVLRRVRLSAAKGEPT